MRHMALSVHRVSPDFSPDFFFFARSASMAQMNVVARAPLPRPAMARIEECLLLEGVVPTDEFARELHENIGYGGFRVATVGEFKILVIADVRRNVREFVVRMVHGQPSDTQEMSVHFFCVSAKCLIAMVHRIKELRKQAEHGLCAPCLSEDPPQKRRKLSKVDVCGRCFLKRAC